ncbi:hypothetical protein AVEN_109484-1 [Araneus ventricosus]|uniref:Uncharacterized protein n=1 Tax=Araneus ventricosus TaxID=182803 RepID=A0A4Y2IHU3_ARAVE|nr:hypothetical protein AVEN_109484-1 [Araneus ventricosus]
MDWLPTLLYGWFGRFTDWFLATDLPVAIRRLPELCSPCQWLYAYTLLCIPSPTSTNPSLLTGAITYCGATVGRIYNYRYQQNGSLLVCHRHKPA